ncbi:hypothetical protein BZA70DRAFT_285008 [Myxozyma melibiosi]|uniref:Uncharacterized protein n=1 Tax=Myxozyma melibiosi TaxID=54550 RepID=A0ABR1EYT4_9ASCO
MKFELPETWDDSSSCSSGSSPRTPGDIDTPSTPAYPTDFDAQSVPVFIPTQSRAPPSEILGDITVMTTDADYVLTGFETFRPKYGPGKVYVAPALNERSDDSFVEGSLCFVASDKLSRLDSWEDEGRTNSRMPCLVSNKLGDELILANVYIWNGNSLLGEFQYS